MLTTADALPLNLHGPSARAISSSEPFIGALARYHRHEVHGLENVPRTGPVLVAVNHSLATYDGLLLGMRVISDVGRIPTGLGDDRLFQTPALRRLVRSVGIVPAGHSTAEELLGRGHLVFVAPGGMREALRPSDERYQVRWERRRGFVRLALRTGTPIVLAACPAADRMYRVYENTWTKLMYRHFHLPLPVVRGYGPTLLPRPVKLVHHVGEALHVDRIAADDPRFEPEVDAVHREVVARMHHLLSL